MKREIESVQAFRQQMAEAGTLEGAVVQGVDLRSETETLLSLSTCRAVFLGCRMERRALDHVYRSGATVFPVMAHLPYRPYRPSLYTPDELLEGWRPGEAGSLGRDTTDAAIYRHYHRLRSQGKPLPVLETLAQRLHDHSVDDALVDLLNAPGRPRKVVAIMGGHAMERGSAEYRTVAVVARSLTRLGYFVSTGGGPGAMEAGNLGAWLGPHADGKLDLALTSLSRAPRYTDLGFLEIAFEVRKGAPGGGESLAIPTWYYGHEPTNVFATHVAKYFANSLREEGLLATATYGVIFAPGSAGTIQEAFMNAAQNHYGTLGAISPMVFLGEEYWTTTRPVLPLLAALSEGRPYAPLLAACDDANSVVDFISTHPPVPAREA